MSTRIWKWLDDVADRAEAATDGPWSWDARSTDDLNGHVTIRRGTTHETSVINAEFTDDGEGIDLGVSEADRAFIAAARSDLPTAARVLKDVLEVLAAETEEPSGASGEALANKALDKAFETFEARA